MRDTTPPASPVSDGQITTAEQLEALLGTPNVRAANKERARLTDDDRAWLAASPFCVVSTSSADGRCDASPKGDPTGRLVDVIDDLTIALAERPGNRRADGYRNVLSNPHVGLLFVIPGRTDTLRINGRARLVTDDEVLGPMAVAGKRPLLAMVVDIEEIFFHCSKAFMRSKLWEPAEWAPEALVPRRAVLAQRYEPDGRTLEELNAYYAAPSYGKGLY